MDEEFNKENGIIINNLEDDDQQLDSMTKQQLNDDETSLKQNEIINLNSNNHRVLLVNSIHSSLNDNNSNANTNEQQINHLKEKENKMKELLRDERLRMVKQKRELEQLKRKEEIEENLKRKQELRDKQLRERQRKIDELRVEEAEKRAAVIERRKLREETAQARLAELIKREQDRETQRIKLKSKIKGSDWMLNNNSAMHSSVIHPSSNLNGISEINSMNKSQSAYNLNSINHNITTHNKKRDQLDSTIVSLTNTKRTISSMRVNKPNSELNGLTSSMTTRTNEMSKKNIFKSQPQLNNTNLASSSSSSNVLLNSTNDLVQNKRNNLNISSSISASSNNITKRSVPRSKTFCSTTTKSATLNITNNSSSNARPNNNLTNSLINKFPAPSNSITIASDLNVLAESAEMVSSQINTTFNGERKKLSSQLQQTVNRLAMPKKKSQTTNETSSIVNEETDQILTKKPIKVLPPSTTKPIKVKDDSELNETTVINKPKQTIASSVTDLNAKLFKKPMPVKQLNTNNTKDSNNKDNKDKKPSTKNETSLTSNSTATLTKSRTTNVNTITRRDKDLQMKKSLDNIKKELSRENISDTNSNSSNDAITTPTSNENESVTATTTVTIPSTGPVREIKTVAEEEYKKKLDERRREAREKAAREAEIEKLRLEEVQRKEEERLRLEEELENQAAEEEIKLQQIAKEQEEERLRLAIEQNQRFEEEKRLKEEAKEEAERKAKEDSERQERERSEKVKKEEEERLERKKKVDLIMKRVHKTDDNPPGSQTNLNGHSTNDLTDLLNTNTNEQRSYKTPLLQSILSKTRINTIYNKYADDSSSLMTQSLTSLPTNGFNSNENNNNKNGGQVEETIDLGEQNSTTSVKLHTNPKVAFELTLDETNNTNGNNDVNSTSANIVPPQISA